MDILRQQRIPLGFQHNITKNNRDIHKHTVIIHFSNRREIQLNLIFLDGSSSRQMWNGNQEQQYVAPSPTRLDYSNQTQRFPPRQSPQYTQAINPSVPTNNCKTLKLRSLFILRLFS